MNAKDPKAGRFFAVSRSAPRGSGTGAFVERVPTSGATVKVMNGRVFDKAMDAANSKLRDVSGKFLVTPKRGPARSEVVTPKK